MTTVRDVSDQSIPERGGRVIVRQHLSTRITHWLWAICMFFLLMSGLQIFNAHPALHIGKEAGFDYSNSILEIGTEDSADGPKGVTTIFGHEFNTSGLLGTSGSGDTATETAFPGWMTIPSIQDLATGRVVHFFFAWIFVATVLAWFVLSLRNRHVADDLLPRSADVSGLGQDIKDHLAFRFHHTKQYSPLQKITYAAVLFILFPLIILTGLTMSPGMDSFMPWLLDIFGGRQTARTIHFIVMTLFVLFFIVHILMIIAAGPINELRSIITGRYRIADKGTSENDHGN